MTTSEVFFDTNIVVYALVAGSPKSERSLALLTGGGTVSVQVLNECANTLRRKLAANWRQTVRACERVRRLCHVVPLEGETHVLGLALAERYVLNVYDGMIVAAAQLAGCRVLYSEDMHDGLVIDKLTIRNPYATGA
jgi:predicted nucleic acid-binding protein